jgi:plastocyanin
MERRKKMQSRVSLVVAISLTAGLFYSMLTWMPAVAATYHVDATFSGGFEPQEITVQPMSDITWENKDAPGSGLTHNLVADGLTDLDKGFTDACNIGPGETCTLDINDIPNPQGYDYHCSIHPAMTGTIVVDLDADPPPEESPSGSPSASGSPSGSPSASASPSPSDSPSPSPSQSASPSPSPSPSPTPEGIAREVTLNLKEHLKAKGKVSAPDDPSGACIEDVEVMIQKKRKHKKGWKTIDKTAQTDADGKYSVGIPDNPGKYRAKILEETRGLGLLTCSAAKSTDGDGEPDIHKHDGNKDRRR